jgi:hypothetical protein
MWCIEHSTIAMSSASEVAFVRDSLVARLRRGPPTGGRVPRPGPDKLAKRRAVPGVCRLRKAQAYNPDTRSFVRDRARALRAGIALVLRAGADPAGIQAIASSCDRRGRRW